VYIDALGQDYRTVVQSWRSIDKLARYRPPNVVEMGKKYFGGPNPQKL